MRSFISQVPCVKSTPDNNLSQTMQCSRECHFFLSLSLFLSVGRLLSLGMYNVHIMNLVYQSHNFIKSATKSGDMNTWWRQKFIHFNMAKNNCILTQEQMPLVYIFLKFVYISSEKSVSQPKISVCSCFYFISFFFALLFFRLSFLLCVSVCVVAKNVDSVIFDNPFLCQSKR